eukprot:Gb_00466 [translate_table: standard]
MDTHLQSQGSDEFRPKVGIVYDERMCKHACPGGNSHVEKPDRIRVIWNKLQSSGVLQRCVMVNAKEASDEQLARVHSRRHIELIRGISTSKTDKNRDKLAAKFNSIYFNQGSSEAAYLAAGSVLEISEKVALGEVNAGVAVVRPPGHHAESDKPMGFCLFNNIAIAAQYLVHERPDLGIQKVLIVDWDVHHGNGTQNMFWSDPQVLYFSVHRYDSGTFYPGGDDGFYNKIGEGPGAGYNINVPWEQGKCGDADYLAVWDYVLIPVARSYNPDMVLISGGFDAAIDDPLGGCRLTPHGYSLMTRKLLEFAGGRIVLALEGGYNLVSLADSFLACVEALLKDTPSSMSSVAYPFESTWHVIQAVRQELSSFWPALKEDIQLTKFVEDFAAQSLEELSSSSSDEGFAFERDEEITEATKMTTTSIGPTSPLVQTLEDIIQPLADLKFDDGKHNKRISNLAVPSISTDDAQQFQQLKRELCVKMTEEANTLAAGAQGSDNSTIVSTMRDKNADIWGSVLPSTYIWYASYGSNMWKPRFLCYIEGGQVEGMATYSSGSEDKTPLQGIQWKVVPHRMFFGRSFSKTWGSGGVAFLHPSRSDDNKAHVCLYKITLAQFNDLLLQENETNYRTEYPLVDIAAIDSIRIGNPVLELMKDSWYGTILYLGTEGGLPILTITCSLSDIEKFKLGQLPICPPSSGYVNTIARGLIEGKGLSIDDAMAYIHGASKSSFL